MSKLEELRRQFIDPPPEFGPIPFWFWNDELSKEEIIKQIHDFHAKEVSGFVIHPRMGLPRTMPYLSDAYFEMVEAAVAEAASLGMSVILYDEGMYPSGSACGLVVKHNPDYASRGLQLREYPCPTKAGNIRIPLEVSADERIVSVQAVRKLSGQQIDPDRTVVLKQEGGSVQFTPPDEGEWSVLLFIDTKSHGTIRGVHPGQDDGEPDAPAAADLLNIDAVQTFIALTHEKYYEKLSSYFGNTVIAMFTDEPDLLGRGHRPGLKPWTRGLLEDYLANGGREQDLPMLWFDAGEAPERIRAHYDETVRSRLSRTYYKTLADWCEAHGIGLTGHPARSDDIGLLEHFHIPGQDVVWRYIGPEGDKAVTGAHSTMGKCSSDAARHRNRRRNLNECFGVCGIEGGWTLTADDLKWYLDWLFIRGVNLISPHAFYYSIRGERRDERPPDVGPNNIWWPEFAQFSRYIKRMSWLMTDSRNGAEIAVLAGAEYLPWRIVKPLYERQIEFNYLEESLLCGNCACRDGILEIAGYRYHTVLIEEGRRFPAESWDILRAFVQQGGSVIELYEDGAATVDIGQLRIRQTEQLPSILAERNGPGVKATPPNDLLRLSRISKDGLDFYVIVNEGEEGFDGFVEIPRTERAHIWQPWTGICEPAGSERTDEGQRIALSIERRECLIVAVDPSGDTLNAGKKRVERFVLQDLSDGWHVQEGSRVGDVEKLSSWTEWDGLEHHSGTFTYERQFEWSNSDAWDRLLIDLGEAHEFVRLWLNGQEVGVRMWKPYVYDVSKVLVHGQNELRVTVTNSLANRYDGKSLSSGLIGPVTLLGVRAERI